MIPSLSPDKSDARPTIFTRWGSGTGLAVVLLGGILLVFYYGLWLPGLVLIKRDAFRYFLPLKQYMVERLSAGELPHWFPYEALGCPFIGISGIGLFHPFTALYFLLPVPDAYRASTLLSCFLAALGAFVLGRMLALSRTGALLAGTAFMLSGYVVSLTDSVLYLYSVCVLPLFCAALEKALTEQRAWVVAPTAIWATVFLHGDVQTGYYYGFIALLWMGMRAPGSYREASLRLALTGGLTLLLAGVQLGPVWADFAGSERAQAGISQEQAMIWSTHPLRLLTILASPVSEQADPVVMGRVFFGNPRGGLWAESLYWGVPVMGLALIGARRRRDLRVLALLACLALLLALGRFGGLYEIFYHLVPFWSAFRYPEKLMGVATFATVMLAGAGFDALRTGHSHPTPWLAAAILCALVGLGLSTVTATNWTTTAFGAPEPLAQEMTGSSARAFLYSAAATLGVWLVVAGFRKGHVLQTLGFLALASIVLLDLARANLGAYHTGPAEAATFTPPLAKALRTREGNLAPGRFRVISIHEDVLVWPTDLQQALGYYGAGSVERRQALDSEHNAQFHLESAYRYLASRSDFTRIMGIGVGLETAARYNVAYYISRRGRWTDPRFAQAYVADLPEYDLTLVSNPVPAKPRVYLSRQPERAALPVDPAALIARSDFLNGEVDVIETSDAHLPGPTHEGTATIERYAPEAVRVRVDTPQPAVLILLDSFDKGWTASLENGTTLPILRANALVRAVVVPAGAHVVTFSYQTPLLKAGAWASLTGVLLCIGLLTHARWRMRSASVDT
ncbi:MAG TPA: YfhO family protein [Candidatus Binatia bacterium]|nr:YfhO family protein [Candidatus Binatia bacterium]